MLELLLAILMGQLLEYVYVLTAFDAYIAPLDVTILSYSRTKPELVLSFSLINQSLFNLPESTEPIEYPIRTPHGTKSFILFIIRLSRVIHVSILVRAYHFTC